MSQKCSLIERIDAGEPVLHASGYLFEMERRGYLQAGGFVPEVVLEHPEVVEQLTREFARAGADVLLAFTYYGHREKMRLVGKEDLLEPLNREALKIARKVGVDYPDKLIAGNICNTNIYVPGDAAAEKSVRAIFEEQIGWIKDAGADMIVGETFANLGEAEIALEVANQAGLPFVLGLSLLQNKLRDTDMSFVDACKTLKDDGADIVGLNCHMGPETMLPFIREICHEIPGGRVAAFPVAYRTTPQQPTFGGLNDRYLCCPDKLPVDGRSFPVALDPFTVTRYEMAWFAEEAVKLGALYVGGCCGTGPHHIRSMAEALGRTPPASKYSADMTKHAILGDDHSLEEYTRKSESVF